MNITGKIKIKESIILRQRALYRTESRIKSLISLPFVELQIRYRSTPLPHVRCRINQHSEPRLKCGHWCGQQFNTSDYDRPQFTLCPAVNINIVIV